MPNHVTHKITFAPERAAEVFAAVCPEGKFSFEILVPPPPHLYYGDTTSEDEQDFKCNWYSWNRENWGTKWGAYSSTCGIEDAVAFIKFDTAWSVPYPILSAFNNRFKMPFEHRYYDEGANFWGIEMWGEKSYSEGLIQRVAKYRNRPEDRVSLCVELKGYDPDKDEEAA